MLSVTDGDDGAKAVAAGASIHSATSLTAHMACKYEPAVIGKAAERLITR